MSIVMAYLIIVLVIVYLAAFSLMAKNLKQKHPEYWNQIGSPSIFDPTGQFAIITKVVFSGTLPEEVRIDCGTIIVAVRVLMIVCLVLLVSTPLLSLAGL